MLWTAPTWWCWLSRCTSTARRRSDPAVRFAAIANCGFPEAGHNDTALAICEQFARQAGYGFAGGLALGAGEGLVHGRPLDQAGAPLARIRKALDGAALALSAGAAIPVESADLLARPAIPNWLYRLVGNLGWRQQARTYAAAGKLKRRPYRGTIIDPRGGDGPTCQPAATVQTQVWPITRNPTRR